jgi:hypothetical protein
VQSVQEKGPRAFVEAANFDGQLLPSILIDLETVMGITTEIWRARIFLLGIVEHSRKHKNIKTYDI